MLYKTELVKATVKGNFSRVKSLVSQSINKNQFINTIEFFENRTVLHVASQRGNLSIVEFLLDNGADINLRDQKGRNAFHFALHKSFNEKIEYGDGSFKNQQMLIKQEICELLISKGFDITNFYNSSSEIIDNKYKELVKKSKNLDKYFLNFSLRHYCELGDKNKVELLLNLKTYQIIHQQI